MITNTGKTDHFERDHYTVIGENGDLENRSRQADKLEELLQGLKTADPLTHGLYQTIRTYDSDAHLKEFDEATAAAIQEVEALKGDLYTREGKNAEIRRRIDELAAEHIENSQKAAEGQERDLADLEERIQTDLARREYDGDAAQRQLEIEEIRGRLLTDMALKVRDDRDLLALIGEYQDRLPRDPAFARFITNNAYILVDRLREVETDQMKIGHAMERIKLLADQAKEAGYSIAERAKEAILPELKKQSGAAHRTRRIIEHQAEALKRKY